MKISVRYLAVAFAVTLFVGAPLGAAVAQDVVEDPSQDRHAGYYYPEVESKETYTARVVTLADSDRVRRLGFVTGLTQQLFATPYSPEYAVFAKGDEAEKMIIVSLQDGKYDTLYRMRALMAMMTAQARMSTFFQENTLAAHATFYDLLKMLGFTQLTLTDGDEFAHQVTIE